MLRIGATVVILSVIAAGRSVGQEAPPDSSSGIPVITSDNSSLPEVVGDSAVLVPTNDTDALADALNELLTGSTSRSELSKRGLNRAQQFSWTESARMLLATYERLYAP